MSDHQVMESEGARPSNWIWAVAAGVVAAVVATWLTGTSVSVALLFGVVVFVIYAVVLAQFWEEPASGDHDHGHGHDTHGHATASHDTHAPVEQGYHAPSQDSEAPVAPAARFAEVAVSPPATPQPVAAAPVAIQPAAPEPATIEATTIEPVAFESAASPVAESAPAAADVAEPVVAPAGATLKPLGLTGPRDDKADALQEIEGIGPALEKLCHELGIFHFDQIAGWGPSEIAWMDGNLKGFKGRVTRDKWVAQARIIATEGVEAFRIRAKTNDY